MRKKILSSIMCLLMLYTLIPTIVVKAQEETADQLVNVALNQKTFYHYNLAYGRILKETDANKQGVLLSKLATITDVVWTQEIKDVNKLIEAMTKTKSGKAYDEIQALIANSNTLSQVDKDYLSYELYSWGSALVYTSDYKEAVDAIIEAGNAKTDKAVQEAKNLIAKVQVPINRDYLLEEVNKIVWTETEAAPIAIEEIKPTIESGQALFKINFKLPPGETILNGNQEIHIIFEKVTSNGEINKVFKNMLMVKDLNSYTGYMSVDATGGSASYKIYYQPYSESGYLSGMLTDQGTVVLPRELSSETDRRKTIEVKEGTMTEVTIDAIKGILFSTKIKWPTFNPITSETDLLGIEVTEKSKDGNLENITVMYYKIKENEKEKEVTYTFAQDKEYSLAFCNIKNTFYYTYGNININDEARKTGELAYQPIEINYVSVIKPNEEQLSQEKKEQLLQEKINNIIARIIKPGMSVIDKEYAIFKYIKDTTFYGFSTNSGNAYGCLVEGISVCEGYSEGTKKLLDAVGIENQIAYGIKGDGVSSGPHAWNIVKIGNEYFHLDTTWNRFNMNDTDAKSQYYTWKEGSIPACNSKFSMYQGLSFFTHDGYIYYTSGGYTFNFDINRCKPDGSENTKLFTTKNGGTFILQQNGWIYYFQYEGSKVYKVRTDGSEETLIYSFDKDTRIHYGDISNNNLYFFVQTGVNGNYKKSIKKLDLGSLDITTIATLDELANDWRVEDYFYYYRPENGAVNYYKMTLDGSVETLIQIR